MPTYDLTFNVAKGRVGELATLPASSDSLIAVPLLTAGIVSAATMRRYATLSALLAGASDEQTTMGRKTLTNVTSAVDQANDKWVVDCDDIPWAAATGGAISAIVICYVPTSGAADSAIVPLVCMDLVVTPNGGDITYVVNALGLLSAT